MNFKKGDRVVIKPVKKGDVYVHGRGRLVTYWEGVETTVVDTYVKNGNVSIVVDGEPFKAALYMSIYVFAPHELEYSKGHLLNKFHDEVQRRG